MRLPLNVSGVPLLITPENTWITILDISNQPEDTAEVVRFLTLYAVGTLTPAGAAGSGAVLSVRVENTDTGQTVTTSVFTLAGLFSLAGLLNHYPLRGNCRVSVRTNTADYLQPVYVYGYYEIAGTDQRPERLAADSAYGFGQGLIPSRSDRVFNPVLGQVEIESIPTYQTGVGQEIVHAFSTDFIDSIDLVFQAETTGGTPFTTELWVYDGADRFAVMPVTSANQVVRIFQNIPMRAAAVPSLTIPGLPAGIHIVGAAAGDQISAWGRFFRY